MTVCLLLAAGSSSRMGQPKMLLDYQGKTLLQHIINAALPLPDTVLLVVTGFYHNELAPILNDQQIAFVKNNNWQSGMASSISAGVSHIILHYPSAENVLILTCDQPFIDTGLLQAIITKKTTAAKRIVACGYGGTFGIPVLFGKKYFNQLALLQGNEGAKKIVGNLLEDTVIVDFAKGVIDIDAPEDYEKLLQNEP